MLLHGVGADGQDLIDLAPALSHAAPDAVFIAPDAPEPYDAAPFGRQWFSLADRTPSALQAGGARAAPALEAVMDAELTRLGLARDAVALAGFSQGAMMALYVGLRRLPPVRGVIAISGALLATPDATADCVAHPPVLLVHGQADEVVPFSRGLEAESVLLAMRVPVQTVWRPGLGHGIDDAGLSAAALFLQRALEM